MFIGFVVKYYLGMETKSIFKINFIITYRLNEINVLGLEDVLIVITEEVELVEDVYKK